MKKITVVGLCFAIPFAVAILGAVITEYVLKIGVLGTSNFMYFLIAGVVGGIIVFLLTRKISFAICTIIGFLLIPYVVFLIGQIDFYMVDDNLAQGITVIEVRPTMDKITFGTQDKGDVAVWSGPKTLQLHPGANRVELGRFDMPAGTYKGGTVYIGGIQVDIQADLSKMSDPASGQAIPAENYAEALDSIKAGMAGNVGGFNIQLINSSLNGNIGTFTISVGSMTQPIPIQGNLTTP